ncbi:multiheme c-type cytochrome [Planctomicrobium sp. SH661]|uniref:multiheme c-type cytochrome n=1 Tax=Planctomicrobium sp. SH661 TaxID=3448124 RepID=UPI003F5B40B3
MYGRLTRSEAGRWNLGFALFAVWLLAAISACNSEPKPPVDGASAPTQTATDPAAPAKTPPANASKPATLLGDWQSPQAALVFTGDIHGYLEPCGCQEKQSGGFARRGGLLKLLREEKKWPTTALDVGDSLNEARITYPQTRIKFSIMLKGLNEMGYEGQALGKTELMLGAQDLYTEFTQVSSEPDFHVPFLGTNTTIFGAKELGTPLEVRLIEIGGMKIGVTAIAGDSTIKELAAAGLTRDANELLVQDPREVLPATIEKLKAEKPDLLVLLSAATMEESESLARTYPEFNIVVTSGSVEDPRSEPVYIGKTMLVQVGKKGKNAAVVGVYPDNQLKYTVLELDQERFEELPAIHDLMQEYQDRLKAAWPELTAQKISDPDGRQFVGVQECKECHADAYDVWKDSKHAHAFESLKTGRAGQEAHYIPRIWDPECLACHTTGWEPQKALRYQSGFIDEAQTPLLAGQQCENCHGPGSEHVALEKSWKTGDEITANLQNAREGMRLTLARAKSETCIRCHDGDNDPHFDFEKYWPDVAH